MCTRTEDEIVQACGLRESFMVQRCRVEEACGFAVEGMAWGLGASFNQQLLDCWSELVWLMACKCKGLPALGLDLAKASCQWHRWHV